LTPVIQYIQLRPPKGVSPKDDPDAWLRYAGEAVKSDIHDSRRKWTWSYMKERRDDRQAYIGLWKSARVGNVLTPEVGVAAGSNDQELTLFTILFAKDASALEMLERKLSFDDLRRYRYMAVVELKRENKNGAFRLRLVANHAILNQGYEQCASQR
jgi:vacuolar protein sorting-associated protein 13A/C